jgi:hypothetical protein
MSLQQDLRVFKEPAFVLVIALLAGTILAGGAVMKYFAA